MGKERKGNPRKPRRKAVQKALRLYFKAFPWPREQQYGKIAAELGILNVAYVQRWFKRRRARPDIKAKLKRREERRRLRKLAGKPVAAGERPVEEKAGAGAPAPAAAAEASPAAAAEGKRVVRRDVQGDLAASGHRPLSRPHQAAEPAAAQPNSGSYAASSTAAGREPRLAAAPGLGLL